MARHLGIHTVFILLAGLLVTSFAQANSSLTPYPNIDAIYNVKFMNISVGKTKQQIRCHQPEHTDANDFQQACQLTNQSEPSRLARALIRETSHEKIEFTITKQDLIWQSFYQQTTRKERIKEIYVLREQNEIVYPAKSLSWPSHPNVYDSFSMVYALQFYALQNKQPKFILQEDDQQQQVEFYITHRATTIDLDFKQNQDAFLYAWRTEEFEAKVWLIEQLNLFPGRIEVYNKKKNRRVTLTLDQAPKLSYSASKP
jgi:hypothetical protein